MSITTTGAGSAGGVAWTPTKITSATLMPGIYVTTSRAQAKLWQNAGKTVPATLDTDPVFVATDPYTGVDFVAVSNAQRPLLSSLGGGLWGLTFDGVDDRMICTAAYTRPNTFIMGLQVTSNPPSSYYIGDGAVLNDCALQAVSATQLNIYNGAFCNLTVTNMVNAWRTNTYIVNGASSSIKSNAQSANGDAGSATPSSAGFTIGGAAGGGGAHIAMILTSLITANGIISGADLTNSIAFTDAFRLP